jgi:TolB protein
MDIGSGNVSRLTYTPGFEAAPAWSPDGLWLVYEGYQENNLDIYVISVDGLQGPIRLTQSDAPDFSPAWSPQPGRQIAYVSWRGGSKDIFVLSLDDPREGAALNLTNTPDLNEDHPAWDPNGQLVAYSAPTDGESLVYVKPVGSPGSEPAAIGRGTEPTWSPNGGSLIYAVHQESRTFLITGQFGNFGVASHVIDVPGSAADLSWARAEIPGPVIRHGSQLAALAPPPYSEEFAVFENPDYRLNPLNNVQAPAPYLSDRVDDSFNALREATLQKTGFDMLGVLQDAWWEMGRRPQPGEAVENWHLTGRAFSLDENLSRGFPPKIWLVREESPTRTYWRVYVRAEVQTGQLGEPLREMPWDFSARTSGDVQGYEQGGKPLGYIPEGYYVDFTQLAADYGWERIAADRTWRQNYAGILYWQFQKTDNLSWQQAMLEIYRPNELSRFLGKPTPLPPLPTSTPTPQITRTPTPLPPDMQ